MDRKELMAYLHQYLSAERVKDYCPNGLQVEGRPHIQRIVTGVTASEWLIREAIERQADAILVHHGYFWRGEDPRVVGQKRKRLGLLLAHDINLFGYHLPLDLHPEVGNNVQLARQLGFEIDGQAGDQSLLYLGRAPGQPDVRALSTWISERLGRLPSVIGPPERTVGKIAWCTGAAQNMLGEAIEAGATVFISGEISEPTVHLAREMEVTYIAAGHHATERYGIRALGEHLAQRFNLEHHFVDLPNPV